jgi:hypothetical protein
MYLLYFQAFHASHSKCHIDFSGVLMQELRRTACPVKELPILVESLIAWTMISQCIAELEM